jgi:hypothetical protein
MSTQKVINKLKLIIPQLAQIQYDLNSQIYYLNKMSTKLGIPDTGIQINTPVVKDSNILKILNDSINFSYESDINLHLIHYFIGTRLGLYDASDFMKNRLQ